MDIRTLHLPLPSWALANINAGHRVGQDIQLLRDPREDFLRSLAMEGMAPNLPSRRQDRIMEGISRYTGCHMRKA